LDVLLKTTRKVPLGGLLVWGVAVSSLTACSVPSVTTQPVSSTAAPFVPAQSTQPVPATVPPTLTAPPPTPTAVLLTLPVVPATPTAMPLGPQLAIAAMPTVDVNVRNGRPWWQDLLFGAIGIIIGAGVTLLTTKRLLAAERDIARINKQSDVYYAFMNRVAGYSGLGKLHPTQFYHQAVDAYVVASAWLGPKTETAFVQNVLNNTDLLQLVKSVINLNANDTEARNAYLELMKTLNEVLKTARDEAREIQAKGARR